LTRLLQLYDCKHIRFRENIALKYTRSPAVAEIADRTLAGFDVTDLSAFVGELVAGSRSVLVRLFGQI